MRPVRMGLAAIVAAGLAAGSALAQERLRLIEPQLAPATPGLAQKAGKAQGKGVLRARAAAPNMAALQQMAVRLRAQPGVPVTVELPFFDDRTIVATMTRLEDSGRGSTRYYGAVEGDVLSSVTMVEARGAFAINVFVENRSFQVTFKGNGAYEVVEVDRSQFRDHEGEVPRPVTPKSDVAASPPMSADDGSLIDVLVLWTPLTRTAAGGVAAIENEIELAVAATNQAYAASNAVQRLRLVHAQEIAYTEPGSPNIGATLGQMQAGSAPFGGITALRDTYGADVVVLFVENGGSGCGVGYFMDANSAGFAPYAMNVTVRSCATGNLTLAHELGHNMGLDHDQYVSPGAITHMYAHGYVNLVHSYRTVMAYVNQCVDVNGFSCPRLQVFSTPLLNESGSGEPLGTAAFADSTRRLNESRVTVANFRPEAAEPTIAFSSANYAYTEGVASGVVTVTRVGSTAASASVTWTTANGTALAGQDFGVNGSGTQRTGTLNWAAGDAASKTISLVAAGGAQVLDDAALEDPESFTITLSSPVNAGLGAVSTATVNITDNDSIIQFQEDSKSVNENGPNIGVRLTRTGSTVASATVTYTTANGSALAGTDFGTTGSPAQVTGVVTFAPGQGTRDISLGPTAASAPYIRTVNDALVEEPKGFTIVLSAPTGAAQLGANSVLPVTINSDDGGIEMELAATAVTESAPNVTLNVLRIGPTAGAVTVPYSFVNGTALNGTHYTGVAGSVSWIDGDATPKPIVVPIIDNAVATPASRLFTLVLGTPTGAPKGTPGGTAVTITDDDNTLQLTAASVTVAESAPTATLNVSRIGGAGAPASVNWTLVNGTATGGADTSGATGGTLNWGAGDAASKPIAIPIVNDALIEGNEAFTVVLSGPTGAALGALTTATVNITDNDAGVILSSAAYEVTEGTANVVITLNRAGPATGAASVTWTTANGTAVAGQDFGTAGSGVQRTGVVSWTAGTSLAKTVMIPILNDPNDEGDETFTVTLSNPSAGVVIGTPGAATVTLHDNDIPPQSTLQLAASKVIVLESGGNAVLTVNRVDAGGGFGLAASASYATVAGTALATSDYTTRSGTLTWGAGDSAPKQITVPIVNNTVAESVESFKVTLTAPSPGASVGTPEGFVVIVDEDEAFPLDGAMPAGFVIAPGATTGWHVSNDPGAYEGVHTLRTDLVDDGETAGLQVARTFAAGTVTFRVKVSSEAGFDVLRFLVDGVEQGSWSGTAVPGWQLVSLPISAGAHTLRWVYEKDGSGSVGQDAAWIDGLVMP